MIAPALRRRAALAAVAAVAALAAIPCFWGLAERGVYYHDEALFLGNGLYYGGMLREAAAQAAGPGLSPASLAAASERLWDAGGTPSLHARPLHEWALAALAALFGSGGAAGPALSATAAVASILALGRALPAGAPAASGLLAAALLGLSAWQLHYARSGMSQSLSLLIQCLLLAALLRAPRGPDGRSFRHLAAIALLSGLAFTTHYNLFWIPALAGLWIAAAEWRGRSAGERNRAAFRSWLGRMAATAGLMAVPPLLFEIPYRLARPWLAAKLAGGGLGAGDPLAQLLSYFEQIDFQIRFFEDPASMPPLSPFYLPETLLRLESPPYVLLLAAGAAYLLVRASRRDPRAVLLSLWTLIPTVFWTRFGYPAPRSFLPVLPALCLGAGLLLGALLRRLSSPASASPGDGAHPARHRPAAAAACLSLAALAALTVFQAARLLPIVAARSPWREAALAIAELRRQEGPLRVADAELSGYNRPILRLYLGAAVDRGAAAGDLLVVDATTLRERRGRDARLDSALAGRRPVVSVSGDLNAGMSLEDAFDQDCAREFRADRASGRIDIYDMRDPPQTAAAGE